MRKAVVDASVWVSATITPGGYPGDAIRALRVARYLLISSAPLVAEIVDVLSRSRIRKRYGITDAHTRDVTDLINRTAEMVDVFGNIHLCRDPNDDMVIETAINGQADLIVTRDEDLARDLELIEAVRAYGIEIVTIERFLRLLDEEE